MIITITLTKAAEEIIAANLITIGYTTTAKEVRDIVAALQSGHKPKSFLGQKSFLARQVERELYQLRS